MLLPLPSNLMSENTPAMCIFVHCHGKAFGKPSLLTMAIPTSVS